MSDRLCLYSPSFRGDFNLLKVWWWVTAGRCLWCLSGMRRPACCMFVRQRARAPCSQIHVILVANHFCSHMTTLPDWFYSAVQGGKIKQMLFEIAAIVQGGRRGGGQRWGVCLLERWSEGWKWREGESVIQSALCHVVTWYKGGRCYSINRHSFQTTAPIHSKVLFLARGRGGVLLLLHDAFEYPCKE